MAESNLQRKLAYLNTLYEIYQEQGIRVEIGRAHV